MANPTSLPEGWAVEPVRVLGARQRIGDENFSLGPGAQIAAITLPGGEAALLISNELGDVRIYSDLFSASPRARPLRYFGDLGPDDWIYSGNSTFPSPDNYQYVAPVPRRDGRFDLIVCQHLQKQLCFSRKLESNDCDYDWPRFLRKGAGVPAALDSRRNGVYDLLLTALDGTIQKFAREGDNVLQPEYSAQGELLFAGDAPIQLSAPLRLTVVDWNQNGRSDLLIGCGDGRVLLFPDIGDENKVRLARGRALLDADGFVELPAPVSPALLTVEGRQHLVVADGDGVLHRWPIELIDSYVTSDVFTAFDGEANGIAPSHRRGTWWMMQQASGALLCAAPEKPPAPSAQRDEPVRFDPPAPELCLYLPFDGLYEIHVTLRLLDALAGSRATMEYNAHHMRAEGEIPETNKPIVLMRLSDESTPLVMRGGESHSGARQELFFKTANLAGQKICFRQIIGDITNEGGLPVYIESVRLVPALAELSEAKSTPLQIAGFIDTFDWIFQYRCATREAVDELIGMHHWAGFDTIYFKLGGGAWEYPSRVPGAETVIDDAPEYSPQDRRFCAKIKASYEATNRVAHAIEAGKKRGMKVLGWIRLQNQGEHRHAKFPVDRFFSEHQDLLEKDAFGAPLRQLCLGWEEVRRFHIAIAVEAIVMGADGIMLDTLRHLPKVAYSDVVAQAFEAKYGLDMRALPPHDRRVIDHQCAVMTRLMRELRTAISKANPNAELHARVCKVHPLMGVDVSTWARENLVDAVVIEHRAPAACDPDIAALAKTLKGSRCAPLAGFARPCWGASETPMAPDLVARKIAQYQAAGAQGITFYESNDVVQFPELRRGIRALKHPEELPPRTPGLI